MYEPAGRYLPNLMFLWPAFAAAAASEFAGLAAKQFADLAVGPGGLKAGEPKWATPNTIALELKTVRLRDFSTAAKGSPTLLCAPFALHGAALTDLAPGHSLVAALRRAGVQRLFVTDWRSASAEMRLLGIDNYLADFNVIVDEIGGPIDLVGLCQGGWMALMFAARFPAKIRKLVLAGAPVDVTAAPSALSTLADGSPMAVFEELVRLGDGVVPGRKVMKFWGTESVAAEEMRQVLQTEHAVGSAAFVQLETLFNDWYGWTLDLPGPYFLEAVEKLYKHNELAAGRFAALGQRIDLATVKAPIFLLAARDDELVAPEQLFAAEHLVGTPSHSLNKAIVLGRHLGLFMGKRVLDDTWPGIVHWIGEPRVISPPVADVRATETMD